MSKLTGRRIFLGIILAMAAGTLPVAAQDQVCQNNCIKNYNACIGECGGTRAAMPWEPVPTEKLAKINECVSSTCRNPLNTCQSDCGKQAAGAKQK
jgi:hypothetical protein